MHLRRKMVRSSEEMAYRMYLADYEATSVELGRPPETWEELTEEEQTTYLRHVEAAFKYLFENGRISSYLSAARLEKLRLEYRDYLGKKSEVRKN
jgi:hypothetical protein